jgi:hypothetical protein
VYKLNDINKPLQPLLKLLLLVQEESVNWEVEVE